MVGKGGKSQGGLFSLGEGIETLFTLNKWYWSSCMIRVGLVILFKVCIRIYTCGCGGRGGVGMSGIVVPIAECTQQVFELWKWTQINRCLGMSGSDYLPGADDKTAAASALLCWQMGQISLLEPWGRPIHRYETKAGRQRFLVRR